MISQTMQKKCKHSKLLNQLYIRGRHNMISTITSTQKFRAIGNIIRINNTELYVFRLRNTHDLKAFLEEVSALSDKKHYWIFIIWQLVKIIVFYMLN